jgi:hypothetical protein
MTLKRIAHYLLALVLIVTVLATISGCIGPRVTGSGNLETREMDYSDFTRLDVGSLFQVTVTRADSFSVSLTLDDNLYDYLVIRRSGSTLQLRLKWGTYLHATLKATITMPDLRALDLSGASRGDVSGFSSSESLAIDVSGASSLYIDDVTAGKTNFDISGASRVSGSMETADANLNISGASTVELDGTADDITVDASGASSVKLADFAVTDASVELSGASNATVNASGELNIDLSGASTLHYLGSPTLRRVDVSGASTIQQR